MLILRESVPPGLTTPQTVFITGSATGVGVLASVSLAAGHTVYASIGDPEGRNAKRAQTLKDRATDLPGSLSVVELDVLPRAPRRKP
jgi:NAD(P)-dependent dehydrogenase (short-subunit alcohol dehydrogenase family)